MAAESCSGPRLPLWRAEKASTAEVQWFFRTMNGRVPGVVPGEGEAEAAARDAAAQIAGWLAAIPTFYKGALALRFTQRLWPVALVAEYGPWTSLAVRLECAKHPSETPRSTDEAETAAARRLVEAIAKRQGVRELVRLRKHAEEHVTLALRAYLRVRGVGPCVLPPGAPGAR
jgi:hypothetical protein